MFQILFLYLVSNIVSSVKWLLFGGGILSHFDQSAQHFKFCAVKVSEPLNKKRYGMPRVLFSGLVFEKLFVAVFIYKKFI